MINYCLNIMNYLLIFLNKLNPVISNMIKLYSKQNNIEFLPNPF
jgi:hypothetical protein